MASSNNGMEEDKECVSMTTVSGELQRIELCQRMMERLSQTDAHFKHQQRGEPDLTLAEKSKIALTVLDKNPVTFLSRFCEYLVEEDLEYFSDLKDNYEVQFYLTQISDRLNSSKNKMTVRNRRYEAMKALVEGGEYFSDTEMKWRDPYLYELMIGQYLTDEERQAEIDKTDLSFSNILLKHLSQQEENQLYRDLRDAEEAQVEEEEDSDDDDEEEAEGGDDEEEIMQEDTSTAEEETESQPKITDEEKLLLREEFLHIMQERFLSGQDQQFDYSAVDANTEYDSLKIREQDEEEKYFDDEPESMDAVSFGDG